MEFDKLHLPRLLELMEREAHAGRAAVFKVERFLGKHPFKSLVFTMLSARTKDDTTLKACKRLFAVADTPRKIAELGTSRLEKILYGVGFYRVKAKHLKSLSALLARNFHSRVPDTLEGLTSLPGVGRKTANIVLARAFDKPAIGVDVHVHRISNLLGLANTKKPQETEKALMKIVPKKHVQRFNTILVAFGQTHSLKNLALDIKKLVKRVEGKNAW